MFTILPYADRKYVSCNSKMCMEARHVCQCILSCRVHLSQLHWLWLLKSCTWSSEDNCFVQLAFVCCKDYWYLQYNKFRAYIKLHPIFTHFSLCKYRLSKIRCILNFQFQTVQPVQSMEIRLEIRKCPTLLSHVKRWLPGFQINHSFHKCP